VKVETLAELVRLGLVVATRVSVDGTVKEYRFTHAGKVLAGRSLKLAGKKKVKREGKEVDGAGVH
jgi:DNA-binding HxlR family transcriptional regulator